MNFVKFKKDEYGYYDIIEYSQEENLQILASFITDSTHIHSAEDILADRTLDEVCGNMYCVVRGKQNQIIIEFGIYLQDEDIEPESLELNEETFAYLINTWKHLNKLNVSEITLSYNNGIYEMTGK